MSAFRSNGRFHLVATAALVAGLFLGTLALAGKPGGGGGGGGSTSGGTIYYSDLVQIYSMNSDGTGKQALPIARNGVPSRLLHGGRRWFVVSEQIPGETTPEGFPRWELFAVRDDGGGKVQLTNDPTLQISNWMTQWMPGEGATSANLSILAKRWVFDGSAWSIDPDSVGLYVGQLLFDGNGNALGLAADPVFSVPLPVRPLNPKEGLGPLWAADVSGYDWSPDLLDVVSSSHDNVQLRMTDVLSGTTAAIGVDFFSHVAWSPAGNVIAFHDGRGNIVTILPDGTGRKKILPAGVNFANYGPIRWSPTGGQLLYVKLPGWGFDDADIYRANANGSGKTNLTSDLLKPNYADPVAWR